MNLRLRPLLLTPLWLLASPLQAALANDHFGSAQVLPSQAVQSVTLNTTGATRQVGEPAHDFNSSDGSVWWKWTAPFDGQWSIVVDEALSGTSYDLAVYTGTVLDQLTLVGQEGNDPLPVFVTQGVTYSLALAKPDGPAQLELSLVAHPANDDFAEATSLGTAAEISVKGNTLAATRETDEPLHAGDSSQGPSIWWEWQAPADGVLLLDLAGSADSAWNAAIYTGANLAGLTELVSRFAGTASFVSRVRVFAGERYLIAAARDDSNAVGEVCLNLNFDAVPFNNVREDAVDLGDVDSIQFRTDITGASEEDGGSGRTLWWKWTPTAAGDARLSIVEENLSGTPTLTAYRELANGDLEEVKASQGVVSFRALAGQTYFLRLRSASSGEGPLLLEFEFARAPANDDFAEAALLVMGENPFDLANTSGEEDEPNSSHVRSLWWTWTAPADGLLLLEREGGSVEMEFFTGTELATLQEVPFTGFDRWRIPVSVGVQYALTIASSGFVTSGIVRAGHVPLSTGHDDFADAIEVGSPWSFHVAADLANATREPGEPNPGTQISVWWRWTAPADAEVHFDSTLSHPNAQPIGGSVIVYRGSALADLVRENSNRRFSASAGQTYYFSVLDGDGSTRHVDLDVRAYPLPPTNDHFSNGADLGTVAEWDERISLTGATVEVGEPAVPDADGSLWWTWTSEVDQVLSLRTSRTFDLSLGVYTGNSVGALQPVFVRPESGVGDLQVSVEAGVPYRIRIDSSDLEEIEWSLRTVALIPGDRFADAIDLGSVPEADLTADSDLNSVEAGEPAPLHPNHNRSVWWRWTAPASGLLYLEERFPMRAAWRVFQGASLPALTEVAVTDAVPVVAGETYFVLAQFDTEQVGSAAENTLEFHVPPPNDDFAAATDLGSAESFIENNVPFFAATLEAGEEAWVDPAGVAAMPGSMWYRWTSPHDGLLDVRFSGSGGEKVLGLFAGESLASLQEVQVQETSSSSNSMLGRVSAGTVYHVLVAMRALHHDSWASFSFEARSNPVNDFWMEAVDLGNGEVFSAAGDNIGASEEDFESGDRASVWWTWTVPRGGTAVVLAEIGSRSERVRIYREDGMGGLQEVERVAQLGNLEGAMGAAWTANAGERYYISVAGRSSSQQGEIELRGLVLDPPDNDAFFAAVDLPGTWQDRAEGTTTGATIQDGEPDHGAGLGRTVTASVWYKWSAPADGLVVAEIEAGAAMVLAVYTGDTVGDLVEVVKSDQGAAWHATAGTTYRLAVVVTGGGHGGYALTLREEVPAPNDDFADRIDLRGALPLPVAGHNFAASAEPPELASTQSIWYSWTAQTDGPVSLNGSASETVPRFEVSTGTELASLQEVVEGTGKVGFVAEAGTTYQISVRSGFGRVGFLSFVLETAHPPPNDDIENRIVIRGIGERLSGDHTFATKQSGEPSTRVHDRTLWWEWTAPATTRVAFVQRSGNTPDFYWYENYTGIPEFRYLRQSFGGSLNGIDVRAGETYYFQFSLREGDPAACFDLELVASGSNPGAFTGSPPNDDYPDRIVLPGKPQVRAAIDPVNATDEPGDLRGRFDRAVWWSWTPPVTAYYEISAASVSFSGVRDLEVYTGELLNDLVRIAQPGRGSEWFHAEAGIEYIIMLEPDGVDPSRYPDRDDRLVGFDIRQGPPLENDDFADRLQVIGLGTVSIARHNIGASAEDMEPAHGGTPAERSVWYEWTPPHAGNFGLLSNTSTVRAGIYRGESLATLVEVASGGSPLEFTAEAGEVYKIAVDSGSFRQFTIRFEEVTPPILPPPNDDFAQPATLTGMVDTFEANDGGSTVQVGEVVHDGDGSQGGSLWWTWTAPQDGPVTLQTPNRSTNIGVYLGDALEELMLVHSGSGYSGVRFLAQAGLTYRIAVASTSAGSGPLTLDLDQTVPGPSNDHFEDAEEMVGTSAIASGTTVDSSAQLGEPTHASFRSCQFSVWYSWTCPESNLYQLRYEPGASACLALYTGSALGNLVLVDIDNDLIEWRATAGTTYWIAVAHSHISSVQAFEVILEQLSLPSNDYFAARIDLGAAVGVPVSGSTIDSTREENEPLHDGDSTPGGSVWWSWTAPRSGTALFDFSPSEEVNTIAFYTGDELANLVVVAEDQRDLFELQVVAGTVYQIAVAATSTSSFRQGLVEFLISMDAPLNDSFDDRIVLPSSLPVAASGSNRGATNDLSEATNWYRTIWWEWTAPTSGLVDFDLNGSVSGTRGGVFTGALLPFRTTIGMDTTRFQAEAGTTYMIGLWGSSSSRIYELSFELRPALPAPANDDFEIASVLTGESASGASYSWGATTQPGEPEMLRNSLWWNWTAPRSGWISLEGASATEFLFVGDQVDALVPVPPLAAGDNRYRVNAGQLYRIASSATTNASEVTVSLEMGPVGDLFADAIDLGEAALLTVAGDLSRATWEPFEPFHAGEPSRQSIWYRWSAPWSGSFKIEVGSSYLIAVYKGDSLTSLCPVAEGAEDVTFEARDGEEYHIAVDLQSFAGEFVLQIVPGVYLDWAEQFFFDVDSARELPFGDYDGDGRLNIFEMAFGTDPERDDLGEISFTVEERWGFLLLSVVRPKDVPGIAYSFEVSRTLDGDWMWSGDLDRALWAEDNGDGTETFYMVLTEFRPQDEPRIFARLRVDLGEDPLDP